MKLFRESIIIFGVYFIGEGIKSITNVPIPGNLIGMILLLVLLSKRCIRLEQIENISNFLLNHMAFFFIPAGVGLMKSFITISDIWIQIFVLCVVTTFVTMATTGMSVQGLIYWRNKRG